MVSYRHINRCALWAPIVFAIAFSLTYIVVTARAAAPLSGPGVDYPATVRTGPDACRCILDEDW